LQFQQTEIELDPASRRDIEITFDSTATRTISPKLMITCESSNQIIKRKFIVKDLNPLIKADLGVVIVGNDTRKTVHLSSLPSLDKHFFAAHSRHPGMIILKFAPISVGSYRCNFTVDDTDIELIGESIPLPSSVDPITHRIQNLIDDNITLSLKTDPSNLIIEPPEVLIPALSTSFFGSCWLFRNQTNSNCDL
jgi:hypothetical protein